MFPFQSRRNYPPECLQPYSGPLIITVSATSHLPWRLLGINSLSPPGPAQGLGLRSLSLESLSSPNPHPHLPPSPTQHPPSQRAPGFCIHEAAFLPTPPHPTRQPRVPAVRPLLQSGPPTSRWQEWEVATGRGSVRWRAGQARGFLQDTLKLSRSGSNSSSRRV